MKKYTITEKEYSEMVEAMNTLTSENQKLRGFIDGMREQLIIGGVSNSYSKHDLRVAFEQARCNKHSFEDWYEYNYC